MMILNHIKNNRHNAIKSMSEGYRRLVLDPRCLKPAHDVNDRYVYIDALEAINAALACPHITMSEKNVLEFIKSEIRKNRFNTI